MNSFPLNIVVAIDKNRGIGKDGDLPWHLPGDLKYFRDLTVETESPRKQNVVVMGRKTWESIPDKFRPLPGRLNVVLTRQADYVLPEGVLRCASFDEMLARLAQEQEQLNMERLFVIGGQQIFEHALKHEACAQLFITHIDHAFDCDTHFPDFTEQYALNSSSEAMSDKDISYHFSSYIKK